MVDKDKRKANKKKKIHSGQASGKKSMGMSLTKTKRKSYGVRAKKGGF